MARPKRTTYAAAGVNLRAADEFVDLIGPIVRRTYGPRVIASPGGFAGLLRLDYDERLFARNYVDPVLVACTDGVGSKILIAIDTRRYDTVGIDLVAMNVNDLLTSGAEPLLFLDYIAVNKLNPSDAAAIVKGVADGCEQAGCALLGGELAEMPDLYRKRHFDLAGFAVGVVERRRLLNKSDVRPNDVLIGMASNGIHSNGYALVRKVLLKQAKLPLTGVQHSLGRSLADELLAPTRIYVRSVLAALNRYRQRPPITGMAHITGGGLPGNVNRILPSGCDAVIRRGSWPIPPIFGLMERHGVDEEELYNVFNMGIGYVMAVRPRAAAPIIRTLEREGEQAVVIGRVRRGSGKVEIR